MAQPTPNTRVNQKFEEVVLRKHYGTEKIRTVKAGQLELPRDQRIYPSYNPLFELHGRARDANFKMEGSRHTCGGGPNLEKKSLQNRKKILIFENFFGGVAGPAGIFFNKGPSKYYVINFGGRGYLD